MLPGNIAALAVAALSAVGLAATARAAMLVPGQSLPTWAKAGCYGAAGLMALCFGLLLAGMIWGVAGNWPERAKWLMAVGFFMTIPATAGAAMFLVAGLMAGGPGKGCFLGLGVAGLLLLGVPALVFATC
ncbi:MAG TPA: hypothetical protein VF574_11155 [Allosphingosinicella sp.]|jgi:hypothetical protein